MTQGLCVTAGVDTGEGDIGRKSTDGDIFISGGPVAMYQL